MINSNNVTLYGKCIKALPGVKFQVKLHDLSKNLNLSFLSNKIVRASDMMFLCRLLRVLSIVNGVNG